jgi:Pyruvate/2-oxoacid:ferredoxin oxidoreductase delta subunit
MHRIDKEKCIVCGICVKNCPLSAITGKGRKTPPFIEEEVCVDCNVCTRVCPADAVRMIPIDREKEAICDHCVINCRIQLGKMGACQRYINIDGSLVRRRPILIPNPVDFEEKRRGMALSRPLLTGVGAGTLYPNPNPAPYIVSDRVEGVDVITAVTEAPLTFSGIKVKIDTDTFVGEERALIKRNGHIVGHVTTEEYGSVMLSIGGSTLMTSKHGFEVARTIVDIANKKPLELDIVKGKRIKIRVGKPPSINGVTAEKMRPTCGGGVGGISPFFKGIVDEVIIPDANVTGLMSEHPGGKESGFPFSGIVPVGTPSTPGRYFGEKGDGWGGTRIKDPRDAVAKIDMNIARPGAKLLVLEPSCERMAMFEVTSEGGLKEIPVTDAVKKAIQFLKEGCEDSLVSAMYIGGIGGGVRWSVTRYPINLNRALAKGQVILTAGGAPTYILPGGGITFLVDVNKMPPDSFTWVPTPATVVPLEFTMERSTFEKIKGYVELVRPFSDLIEKIKTESL